MAWRTAVLGACVLNAAMMMCSTVCWAANDATPSLTPRMTMTRALIAQMTDPTGVTSMALAPDGKHIAVIGWTGRAKALLLTDADTLSTRILVAPEARHAGAGLVQPLSAHWITNETLAVDFSDGDCVVVDLDGRHKRVLGDRFLRVIPSDKPDQAPEWVIVGTRGLLYGTNLHRVNVITGQSADVPIDLPGDLVYAVFDRRGRLRAASTRETKWSTPGAKITNWYRHDEHSPWQQIAQAAVTEDLWKPLGVPDDSDTLVVLSREERDTWAMFAYDVASRRTTELIVGHPSEDLIGTEEDASQNIIRAMTHGLKPNTYWFDARWDQLQRSIDAVMPETVNILRGDPQRKVLVFSYSDRDPGRWQLFDARKMTLSPLGERNARVDTRAMRPMQAISYAAGDGMKIPAYLTLPEDGPTKPRPMVVYIHGGPVARDEWGWDLDVQLLAASGYAVLQPEFRGSAGFGRKFEQAGYRQWGLAMQDDVTAGVKAMIDRGIADPDRICIYGASYGGYAALWGLVKTPELYRCGISLAGVTDIGELFTDWSDTNASKVGQEWMRFRVGDVNTMAAQFAAVSPEKHAAQIRVPVLLAHGDGDERVPIGHSKRMASALKAAHASVETHWYEYEGHGLSQTIHIRDFEAALMDFLDRNIGPASPAAAKEAAMPPAEAASAVPAQQ